MSKNIYLTILASTILVCNASAIAKAPIIVQPLLENAKPHMLLADEDNLSQDNQATVTDDNNAVSDDQNVSSDDQGQNNNDQSADNDDNDSYDE